MQSKAPAIITGGEGCVVRDIYEKPLIDAVGGLWNVNLGYSCDPVKQAIADQLQELPYYSTFRGTTNDKVIELSEMLYEFFQPAGMVRSFFTSGGSDSIEVALRLARQQATNALGQYIDGFYNPIRRHSSIGYKSPIKFEAAMAETV